jgi:hypothetical protein
MAKRGLLLDKLACQAGFVISFYDLSKLGEGAPFSAARTHSPDQIIAVGRTSSSTSPKGPSPQPAGRGTGGANLNAVQVLVKEQGGNGAQPCRALQPRIRA